MNISLYFMAQNGIWLDVRERDPIRYLLGKHRVQWMFGITQLPFWERELKLELELELAQFPNDTVGGELSKLYCLPGR